MPDVPGHARQTPVSTYRLQLQAGFGFAEAGATADYLAGLGVTHAYLSPILQAAPGSRHGYDVVDHSRISAELGGADGFRAMVGEFHRSGLGVVADIVPNHMAIPVPESLNAQLWSVLREGQDSPYARWFDVDWAAREGRMLLPILGAPPSDCLDDLEVDDADGQPVLRYFEHVLPLRPGTEALALDALIDAQPYELADWHEAATSLNWRRFFDISSLIAIRVEDPDVFTATHELVLGLMAEGLIDALRVDHPDGLADPRGYLERLAKATGGAWVATEKVLTGTEVLPRDWPCAGTTGYDALEVAGGLFVDPAGRQPLTEVYTRFTAGPQEFGGVAHEAKVAVAAQSLAAEVSRLCRLAARANDPVLTTLPEADVRAVLVELLGGFAVYRAYVVPGETPGPAAVDAMDRAVAAARRELPAALHTALDAMRRVLLGQQPPDGKPAADGTRRADAARTRTELIIRFQQTCGPIMAKGVEDTAFYRWSRLAALNEVGGEPSRFGVSPEEFHSFCGRIVADWPATMTTLSTHDTKRQEDVRARLWVLAELTADWRQEVAGWHARAARLSGGRVPEPDTEYLMWQTLAGAWPLDRERLHQYLRKAMREAKTRTSWTEPREKYESMVLSFADRVLRDPELTARIDGFAARIEPDARVNSLGVKLVQLTMPGVADVYQGCELTALSLVDPDNRRPVDFTRRRQLLAALDAADPATGLASAAGPPEASLDTEKLLVTAAALRLRRDNPDWFAGPYAELPAVGPAAGHAVGFLRGGHVITVATRLPAGLREAGGWDATALTVPPGTWLDVLTGDSHEGPHLELAALTRRLPVALLIPGKLAQ